MLRKIIKIDEDKCNGCGICATACHEGAIGIIHGKARLLRDDYCDGVGDCLPTCPTGAITFEEREALKYDATAVKAEQAKHAKQHTPPKGGCPGSNAHTIERNHSDVQTEQTESTAQGSELRQWPCQIKLAPVNAPYFNGANLLISAD
ncbi:MAG: 4Fe-4S binding protein, partial [Synergistaceae bacterium]|nr:4Fe-4S binding protein [Synergistaceae bacterium]